jgi:signal transduction histidine kinase
LRPRIVLAVAVPLVLVIGVYGLLRIRTEQTALLDEDRRNVAGTARAMQLAIENALHDRPLADVQGLLTRLVEDQRQIDRVRLFDRELSVTLVSNGLAIGDEIPRGTLQQVLETGRPDAIYQHRGAQRVLYYLRPLHAADGAVVGAMELVHLPTGVDERVAEATRDVWVRLSVLLVAVTALIGVMLQRQVLRPLGLLLEGIRGLAAGAPRPPLPVDRPDELGRVAVAFNRMVEQLEEAQRRLLVEADRTLDLERQLRQAETLAVVGKLTSSVAHEVGTPLNIVSGRAEHLLKGLPADHAGRADLAIILAQIERISGILRSLLDTVRPRKPNVQPTRVAATLDQVLPLLRHAAAPRGVRLAAMIPGELPPVLADPSQLQQVLINVVMNALEATPRGGRVELTGQRGDHGGRAGVTISVADTGPGIRPELLPQVFEPFFTTKPPGQGTGLGLAICRDIVQQHGGEIDVQSQPGAGTTVTVWLPEA